MKTKTDANIGLISVPILPQLFALPIKLPRSEIQYFVLSYFQYFKKMQFLYNCFLVGAFSFEEKSPTITVASFFFFFFVRPQSSSRMYHFLQKLISSLRPSSTNANLLQRVPPFVFYLFYVTYKTGRLQRVPPFNFFSALCEFFSKNFNFSKESPLRIF